MKQGHFYFLKDQYFIDFPDDKLMKNKETINGDLHNRPSFYAIKAKNDIFWMIPFSSQVSKFKKIYNAKVERYGKCDTIVFGDVLGYEKAFLIQNMCPVTEQYISNEYMKEGKPILLSQSLQKELVAKAEKVLALARNGNPKLLFPDSLKIERLLKE